jgi:hypothetical protein
MSEPQAARPVPAPPTAVAAPPAALQRIEQAVTSLAGLDDRPLDEHPEAYEGVHRVLREALSDIQGSDIKG